ncbi:unnamed protein product [Linum trigynum]|uniref:Uncharacterized protein n=1 Tax=Linum trigynum TaxID=586398 RepID=A0AAV2GRW3_9ROSI
MSPHKPKVVHKHLHDFFNQSVEDGQHTTLKCDWGIAKPKWDPPVGKCAERTGEGGLRLIFRCNGVLKVLGHPIQETVELVPRQPLLHLVDEG